MKRTAPKPSTGIRWARSLRGRLALFYGALVTALLCLFGAGVYAAAVITEAQEDDPPEEKERELRQVRRLLLLGLGAAVPLGAGAAVAGGAWMSRRTLRAIDEVVRTAEGLGLDGLGARVRCEPGAGAEIEALCAALNGALSRIEAAADALRRFVGDAAHELRTPIAAIMADLELCLRRPRDGEALREAMGAALEELGGLARLLDVLLTLARADAGQLPAAPAEVDVAALLRHVADPYEALAAERGLHLRVEAAADLRLRADPLLLGRVLANLLDNACKFLPAGGTVALRARRGAEAVELLVEDDGPGLGPEEAQRAFERFYRGARHRGAVPGFGLGLPLAQELARALGGQLALSSRPGGGLVATLALPSPPAP